MRAVGEVVIGFQGWSAFIALACVVVVLSVLLWDALHAWARYKRDLRAFRQERKP